MPAIPSSATLPVLTVIHHISTNWVKAEPSIDIACPANIVQNLGAQRPRPTPWFIGPTSREWWSSVCALANALLSSDGAFVSVI